MSNVTASSLYSPMQDDRDDLKTLNFTLRDTANNYILRCVWGPFQHRHRWEEYVRGICKREDPNVALSDPCQQQTLVRIRVFGASNIAAKSVLTVLQEWYCPFSNVYPTYFQATGGAEVTIGCPVGKEGSDMATSQCDVLTSSPIKIDAKWIPPGPAKMERQLIPHPDPLPTPLLGPAPSKECTELSVSHPDWTVEDLVYVPDSDSSLMVTLNSRALEGLRFVCQSSGKTAAQSAITLSCTRDAGQTDAFNSSSVFSLEYNPGAKNLRIQRDCLCGDTKGTFKTDYRAASNTTFTMTPSNTTAGGYQLASQVVMRGKLLRPLKLTPYFYPFPPNTNTTACTSKPAKPFWVFDKFFVSETSTETVNAGQPQGKPDVTRNYDLDFTNQANGYKLSCAILRGRDTPEWFQMQHPSRAKPKGHRHPRQVECH